MGVEKVLKTVKYTDKVVIADEKVLEKLHSSLLKMIKDVSEVLDELGIKWTLSGGNILGAIRHGGFIPWDDDIDIFFEREEYEKFKKAFNNSRLKERYNLREPGEKGYLFSFPRIEDKKNKIKDIQSVGEKCDGLFIDVFILENTYDNRFFRSINGFVCSVFLFIESCLRMDLCKKNILYYTNDDTNVKRVVNKRAMFAKFFKFMSLERWLKISDKYFKHINNKSLYVVCPSGNGHFFGEMYIREKMNTIVRVPFDGLMLWIPSDYDHYLRKHYGENYQEIPPENKKERHIYAKLELEE